MSKNSKKPRTRKQGRDLNVLYSLTGKGQKMIQKILPGKKKVLKVKHKKDVFHENDDGK